MNPPRSETPVLLRPGARGVLWAVGGVTATFLVIGNVWMLALIIGQVDDLHRASTDAERAAESSEQSIEEIRGTQLEGSPVLQAIEEAIDQLLIEGRTQTGIENELTAAAMACAIRITVRGEIPRTAVFAERIRTCTARFDLTGREP